MHYINIFFYFFPCMYIFYSRGQLGGGSPHTLHTPNYGPGFDAARLLSSACGSLACHSLSATFVGHHHEYAVQSCHVDDATLALNPEQCILHQCAWVCKCVCVYVCLCMCIAMPTCLWLKAAEARASLLRCSCRGSLNPPGN